MHSLDYLIRKYKVTPVFFHGSGGSVDRGGGSLKEQTSWWPKSALHLYKATIQGEMVERTFSNPQITLSGVDTILTNLDSSRNEKYSSSLPKELKSFAKLVEDRYVQTVNNPNFFKMIEVATPYSYLKVLKLGSRPSKRSKFAVFDLKSIRAIPWVLCWTQTRTLFPTWWGIGSAWNVYKKDKEKQEKLLKIYKSNSLFSSFIRTLSFTLSKVDLHVFQLYLQTSSLEVLEQEKVFKMFQKELQLAHAFLEFMTEGKDLLWFRPWLKESINLRSSMIHPLNILQIIGNKTNNLNLIRTSVAGISSGMMTTG